MFMVNIFFMCELQMGGKKQIFESFPTWLRSAGKRLMDINSNVVVH